MTWVLIMANLMGGGFAQVSMPDEATCAAAVLRIEAKHKGIAAWCVPAGRIKDAGVEL